MSEHDKKIFRLSRIEILPGFLHFPDLEGLSVLLIWLASAPELFIDLNYKLVNDLFN